MIISINGNIGSGKSTLMKLLEERLSSDHFVFVREPVDIWQNIRDEEGIDLITNFYRDQKAHSFKLQMVAYISMLDLLKNTMKENPNKIIISERCMHTARHVFAKMLYDVKKMSLLEYTIYDMWYDALLEGIPEMNYVYLKTDAEVCHERIDKRNRTGEDSITLDYLKDCDKYHDEWLTHENNVIVLDGNTDFEINEVIIDRWVRQIMELV